MKAPILNRAQWQQVEEHVQAMKRPSHYRLLVLLVRQCGLRPIELANLQSQWFAVDDTLTIPLGYSKGNATRTICVSPEIMNALETHMAGRTGRVFINQDGDAFNAHQMSASVRRLMGMAGVKASAYSGRRGLATRLVDEGVNIRIIQEVLGHADLSTTAKYCEVTPSMMRRAMFG
jgi:site-specific recombinase XerD